jgi:hypothetical protein
MASWSAPVTSRVAAIRAGGRRGVNRERQDRALIRDRDVERLAVSMGMARGTRKAIADMLGISLATVTRSLKRIKQNACTCPGCHFYRSQQHPRQSNKPTRSQNDPVMAKEPVQGVRDGHRRGGQFTVAVGVKRSVQKRRTYADGLSQVERSRAREMQGEQALLAQRWRQGFAGKVKRRRLPR